MLSPDRKPEIAQNPSFKSVTESLSRFIPSSIPLKRAIIRHPALRTLTNFGLAGMVAVSAISSGINNPVQAEGQNSPKTETTSLPPNPINFNFNNIYTEWLAVHGTFSFSGSGRGMDTVEVSKDRVYSEAFQAMEDSGCYSEITKGLGIDIIVWGMVANPVKGKGAIATVVSDNLPDYIHPKGGEIVDLAKPGDLSRRICLTSAGLPDTILRDGRSLASYIWGTDVSGDYLEQGIKNAVDPVKNGKYTLRLSTAWNGIGYWVKQQAYKLFLPINLQGYPG